MKKKVIAVIGFCGLMLSPSVDGMETVNDTNSQLDKTATRIRENLGKLKILYNRGGNNLTRGMARNTLVDTCTIMNKIASAIGQEPVQDAYSRGEGIYHTRSIPAAHTSVQNIEDLINSSTALYVPDDFSPEEVNPMLADLLIVDANIASLLVLGRRTNLEFIKKYNTKNGLLGENYVVLKLIGLMIRDHPKQVRSLLGLSDKTYVLIGHTSFKAAKKRALHSHLITYVNDYVLYGHLSDEQKQGVKDIQQSSYTDYQAIVAHCRVMRGTHPDVGIANFFRYGLENQTSSVSSALPWLLKGWLPLFSANEITSTATLIANTATTNHPCKLECLRVLMSKTKGIDYDSLELVVKPIFIALVDVAGGDGWYKRLAEEYMALIQKKPK